MWSIVWTNAVHIVRIPHANSKIGIMMLGLTSIVSTAYTDALAVRTYGILVNNRFAGIIAAQYPAWNTPVVYWRSFPFMPVSSFIPVTCDVSASCHARVFFQIQTYAFWKACRSRNFAMSAFSPTRWVQIACLGEESQAP